MENIKKINELKGNTRKAAESIIEDTGYIMKYSGKNQMIDWDNVSFKTTRRAGKPTIVNIAQWAFFPMVEVEAVEVEVDTVDNGEIDMLALLLGE